ncbi:interleukin-1 beta [Cololabis saira]|uniref:interleukin-1 beta n=1 Tax=Cololabis saira TaxID=129043 RepID=UPI002AD55E74|nr:interleukin-1 beta [Cololabis saira]
MHDFELSDALDGTADAERVGEPPQARRVDQSEGTENLPLKMNDCYDMKDVKKEIFKINEDLNLMVCHNPRSMQSVANLVLVANWMNPGVQNNQLCSVIMDHVVEETIFNTEMNTPTTTERVTFRRMNSQGQCLLCDTSQKNLIKDTRDTKLQAIVLKGGDGDHKVTFKMARYAAPSVCQDNGQAVLLSITDNLHISCSKTGDSVELKLENCSKKDLIYITKGEDRDRFLFFSRTSGLTITRFESVKYCGWFISTSSVDTNPSVEMCRDGTDHRLTTFKTA